ncbi:MAG: hypothetical protein ACWGPN_14990, partial [Gammaproteobacteria bacterium]
MKRYMFSALAAVILWGCGNEPDKGDEVVDTGTAAAEATAVNLVTKPAAERLLTLVDQYFEDNLELNPVTATFIGDHRYDDRLANSIGPEHRAADLAMERRYLAALGEIDPAELEGQNLLTYEV